MDLFRKRFGPRSTFIMASDSAEWIREHFNGITDVFILDGYKTPKGNDRSAFDFGVLSRCNHSIIR